MPTQFNFDPEKTAQQNIDDFLSYVRTKYPFLGQLLQTHVSKMLPLAIDPSKRSAARAAFNAEIKKQLDALLAAKKSNHA
jgi:hypothetical protein